MWITKYLSSRWLSSLWIWCICVLWYREAGAQQTLANIQSCRSEYESNVHWYSTALEDFITSDPLCLDEAKFLLTRNCTDEGWVPHDAPKCTYKQEVRSVFDNFAQFSGYEFFVMGEHAEIYRKKKTQWSRDCMKFGFTKDILEFQDYLTKHPDYYWMPIRRHRKHFPHVWHNLGKKFGLVTEDYLNHGNEDCLVVNFSSNHIKSIPCNERYSEICLYVYESPLLQLSCPKDHYTTRFQRKESKCFQVSKRECNTLFRYTKPHDRIIYKALMSKFDSDGQCRIEIDPFRPNMTFTMEYWMSNIHKVNYVNWSPTVNSQFSTPLSTFTIADKEGDWLLSSHDYKCTICEQNLVVRTPGMHLTFNYEEDRLELFVSHPEFLWTDDPNDVQIACFTTGTDALLANVDLVDQLYSFSYTHGDLLINMAVYEVEIKGDGPGEYWCEAVAHPSFDLIATNREVVYAVKKGVVFAIRAVHQCKMNCMGVYNEEHLKNVSHEFEEFLKELHLNLDVEDVRVMDVLSSISSRETLLFHVTFSIDDLPDELDELNFEQESDSNFLRSVNIINYVMKQLAPHNNSYLWNREFSISGYTHTLYCVTETAKHELIWGRMNEIKVIPNLCLNENYVLNTAQCVGEFPYGVSWDRDIGNTCVNDREAPPLTRQLFEILSSRTISVDAVLKLDDALQDQNNSLNPADVFLLGSLLGRFVHNVTQSIGDPQHLIAFARIFSQSLRITVDSASMSHRHMNATNLILDNYERLLQRSSIEFDLLESDDELEYGVVELKTINTRSFIIDPSVKNITGIAFYLSSSGDEFGNGRIKYLDADQVEQELLEDETLEGAAFLPRDLLDTIRVNFTGPLRIVMTIIENHVLFRSASNESDYQPTGRVITASIPNYDRPLPALFPIIFRPRRDYVETDGIECSFWNFHPADAAAISEWSTTGCDFLAKSSRDTDPAYMCGCQHFTNFAILMTGINKDPSNPNVTETERKILISLDIITTVGCTLSLLGVLLIWLTALVFRSWREREGTKVLLQLSFGIGLQVLMMLLINIDQGMSNSASSCIIIGIILHYTVLVIFSWMLITAYLQYLRYVVVFGNLLPKRFFLKANIVGWIGPILPCLIICIIDPNLYVPSAAVELNFENTICYPQGHALVFGAILPVCVIIFINLCVFVLVIYNITTGLQKCNNNRKGSSKIHRAQLRLTILLFFLLGLTWSFGLLVHFEHNTYIFTYLFAIFGTLQGFVLFIYFIILDPQTRKLWLSRFSCCYKKEVTSSTYNS